MLAELRTSEPSAHKLMQELDRVNSDPRPGVAARRSPHARYIPVGKVGFGQRMPSAFLYGELRGRNDLQRAWWVSLSLRSLLRPRDDIALLDHAYPGAARLRYKAIFNRSQQRLRLG